MIDKTIAEHLQERREVHRGIKKTLRHYVAKPYVEVAGKNLDDRIKAIV